MIMAECHNGGRSSWNNCIVGLLRRFPGWQGSADACLFVMVFW
jgi:hypothetical protein